MQNLSELDKNLEGTTVNDNTFFCFVAHNIAVLLQHVYRESFYINHILIFFNNP